MILVGILYLCLHIRKKQEMKVCNGEYYSMANIHRLQSLKKLFLAVKLFSELALLSEQRCTSLYIAVTKSGQWENCYRDDPDISLSQIVRHTYT